MMAAQTVGYIDSIALLDSRAVAIALAINATITAELESGPARAKGKALRQATTIAVTVAPINTIPTPWGKKGVRLPEKINAANEML